MIDVPYLSGPDWEPSAWMREALARRTRQLEGVQGRGPLNIVPASLTGWDANRIKGTREDRCCDRCGAYVPPRLDFLPGIVSVRRPDDAVVMLGVGLCRRCADAEAVA